MRQSELFSKTRKEPPSDEVAKNAQLLIQAGYVHKEMAGVYAYLPLGLRVLENLLTIIREEMNAVGGEEISLTALQDKEVWSATDRWSEDAVDVWFKTKLKNSSELGLGFTHEEPLTRLMKNHVSSYKDLPVYPYQIQTKFRNETRAKSGLMRGREFLMKDLYSFSKDEKEHRAFYEKMKTAYMRIFDRVGIGEETFITFASGGSFSEFSHEFQTLCEAGEDTIFLDRETEIAVNKEVYSDDVLKKLSLDQKNLEKTRAVEVGNIFTLGTRFSEPLNLTYTTQSGEEAHVFMGSYGIGPERLLGTIVELYADDHGIVWPESVAPFAAHLLVIGEGAEVQDAADSLFSFLQEHEISVLYDDRDISAGEKFGDADLLGIPYRLVVSSSTVKQDKVEIKKRGEDEENIITKEELLDILA